MFLFMSFIFNLYLKNGKKTNIFTSKHAHEFLLPKVLKFSEYVLKHI